MLVLKCVFVFSLILRVRCELEGHIANGVNADIKKFPHSAFLGVICMTSSEAWKCGASILNQRILVTAAHCLDCTKNEEKIEVNVGDKNNNKGFATTSVAYIKHRKFNSNTAAYDIGLVMTRQKLPFSNKISRLAIMRNPPAIKNGKLAGWGVIDEVNMLTSTRLKEIDQEIWDRKTCRNFYNDLPPGCFCAANKDSSKSAASGDSGSALIFNGYIGIGLVSSKKKSAGNLALYTNLSYYYTWIKQNAERLFCDNN